MPPDVDPVGECVPCSTSRDGLHLCGPRWSKVCALEFILASVRVMNRPWVRSVVERVEDQPGGDLREEIGRFRRHALTRCGDLSHPLDRGRRDGEGGIVLAALDELDRVVEVARV